MPLSVDLHFQFWNGRMERLPAPGTEEFWTRRTRRTIAGTELETLSTPDALAYAALHALKHVLRGTPKASHLREIACILDSHAAGDALWTEWRALHSPELRRLQAVVFRLALEWFGCRMPPAAQEETERLPAATQAWFADFATSPASSRFDSNKDQLWLHLSLLDSRRDAWSVARLRLLPANLPSLAGAASVSGNSAAWRYAAHVLLRLRHHAISLPRIAASGARWRWRTNSLGRQFWTFLTTAVLLHLALFIFALLYNLFLLDLGFREDFLGVVNGAAKAGTVVGTLPAAFLAHRFGLRNTLLGTLASIAAIEVMRVLAGAQLPLAALAFVSGSVFSVWAVILMPSIAGAVEQKHRPTAFSVFFATMFAVGIAGNWLGGHLSLWLDSKRTVLLIAAAMAALALVPAWRLKPAPVEREGARVYPRGPFLVRYLVPFALWHLATGSFNPFNNVYFARLRFPVERIGTIFSGSQLVQVATVLLTPLVFRRAGLVPGIVWMMAATALGLAGLASQPSGAAAPLAYIAYMSFQWMSEPGLNTLLMNQVDERERGGASALNNLVAFSAQAVAAFGAGALLTRFGYGAVLTGAAALAGLAAGLFRMLLGSPRAASLRAPAGGNAPE
jgi:predicted MFS family arabinose efflux permease